MRLRLRVEAVSPRFCRAVEVVVQQALALLLVMRVLPSSRGVEAVEKVVLADKRLGDELHGKQAVSAESGPQRELAAP